MKKNMFRGILLAVVSTFAVSASFADSHNDEPPFIPGDYWEVTGIKVADGAGLKYAKHLASQWRKNMDFAKSKGWLKDYMVISNVHPRSDEPDLYLITVFEQMASVEEGEKRRKAWMEFSKKSMSEWQAESGDRAEYRTIMSESLLRHLKFRD